MTESWDTLILLALFILLPLIERLLRAARRSQGDSPEQTTQAPPPVAQPSIPSPPPLQPPIETRVPPPVVMPQVRARPAPRPSPRPPTPAAGAHRAVRSGGSGWPEELHTRHALRRAIVLATIIGPCRAADPYERGQPSSPEAVRPDPGNPPSKS